MDELKKTRQDIDDIDNKILELLNKRAASVKRIADVKKDKNLPPFDPSREKRILNELSRKNKGPMKTKDIEFVMDAVFKVFRGMFRPIKIAYFGPEGTFTHQAAVKQFGQNGEYIPCRTIDNVFTEVEKGRSDYGVVPVENSIEGSVTHTLDMFVDSNLRISAEILLDVHHFLLSREKSIDNVKKVFSHSQPVSQCWNWLSSNLPHVDITEADSTTDAVQKARREKHSAAIASETAASLYMMNVLASNIEDFSGNITRFLVIGKEFSGKTRRDQTSVIISIKDRIGALQDILGYFTESGINLTRIESRPSKKKAWDYLFFLDFIGHKDDNKIRKVLSDLEKESVFLKVLGSYPVSGRK